MASDFCAYVFYVNRPDLLKRSIAAFPDLEDELTIVDNSVDGIPFPDPRTFRPPVPLSYTQSMNWMLKDAKEKQRDFIVHFHSDTFSSNLDAVRQLLDYVRNLKAQEKRWACAWTFYDILWAINPTAAKDIGGWDTVFSAYYSDNDQRRRWTLAGWECIDTHIEGVNHEGSATIKSDPKLNFLNGQTFPLYRDYYIRKWGGEPGHEIFSKPFNGAT